MRGGAEQFPVASAASLTLKLLGVVQGVAVNQECIETFNKLKLGKQLKFIIFALAPDNKEIVVESSSASPSYDDFIAALPADSCRYAVYDLVWEKPNEGTRSKLCFYAWSVHPPAGGRVTRVR